MRERAYGPLGIGSLVVMALLVSSVAPGQAWSGGGGGMHGGGGGGTWHGGGGSWHGGWHGHGCCFGPRVFFGFGVGFPFWYPYPYAYPYPVYVPPAVVEPSPPVYVQQQPQPQYQTQVQSQYWYYCPTSQTYYPYVKECASGWLQVVPQTSPPPPTGAPR